MAKLIFVIFPLLALASAIPLAQPYVQIHDLNADADAAVVYPAKIDVSWVDTVEAL